MKSAVLFPGQGSQQPGMGRFLHDEFKIAKETFEEASDAIQADLKKLCFEGSVADLALTENTQPCLLAVSTATHRVLESVFGLQFAASAGHSVGEYAALVAGGVIPFPLAVKAVKTRGQAMQAAVPVGQGGMAAVLGLSDVDVPVLCEFVEKHSLAKPLNPANYNCPGQVVVSGNQKCIDYLVKSTKPEEVFPVESKSFKVKALQVSAPFHCNMMAPAQEQMKAVLEAIPFKDSRFPIVQNKTALFHQSAVELRQNLVEQISASVLWTQSMKLLIQSGFKCFVESGTGKVLQGLLKKIDSQSIQVFNTNSLQELKQIEASLQKELLV